MLAPGGRLPDGDDLGSQTHPQDPVVLRAQAFARHVFCLSTIVMWKSLAQCPVRCILAPVDYLRAVWSGRKS